MIENHIVITLPSNNRWLHFAQDSVRRYGQIVGFPHKLEQMLTSSVMEALEELLREAEEGHVTTPIDLCLDLKDESVVVDISYDARIALNPHETKEYEVPESESDADNCNVDSLWLHLIKSRMDRVLFMIRGSHHVLRMVKYRRDEGQEKLAWIMGIKPELRKGLILHLSNPNAPYPSSVLQAAGAGVLKLGPSETFFVRNMDGKASFQELYMSHLEALGLTSPDTLAKLYKKLESMKMLVDPEEETHNTRLRQLYRKIINPNFSLPHADAIVTAVYGKTHFLCSYVGLGILLAVGLSGIVPCWQHLSHFKAIVASLGDRLLNDSSMMFPVYALILVHAILHELGHGVTCKHYGGKVPRLGIMFYLATFIFYCDTTAAWNFPEKRHRILVSLGGPIISFAVLGAGCWAAGYYANTNSIWEYVFVTFTLCNVFFLAMNFNPFIKMDAYYILSDYTGIANLRKRAFLFLKRKLLGWVGCYGPDKHVTAKRKEQRVFWWYGILGGMVTVLFTLFPFLLISRLIYSDSPTEVGLLFALIAGALLMVRLSHVAFTRIKAIWFREYTIQ